MKQSRITNTLSPLAMLSTATLLGLAMTVWVTLLATGQPWLGLQLSPAKAGGLEVMQAGAATAGLPVGTVLVSIADAADRLRFEPIDLVAEPDGAMGDYASYRSFLARQQRLARIQASSAVTLTDSNGHEHAVSPAPTRPLSSLPVAFWVQVVVGFVAWLIASAVFAFRPGDASARYLLLSGAATLTFAPLAAIYSTRELALPGGLFQWINDGNFLGGSLFTASFVALLLNYPRRIGPRWLGNGVVALFVVWFVLQEVGLFESMTFARRFLVLLGVLSTFVLAAIHWFGTRRDPAARAALQWFLLSWMLGTCLFALLILLPQMFGMDTSNVQGYAFLLFLLVYVGLGFGILRYRLFQLGQWWGRIVIWALSLLVLVLLDLLFLFALNLSSGLSLSLALLITGLFWLPLRALIWNRVLGQPGISREALFGQVIDVALALPGSDQGARWQELMRRVFDPLAIQPSADVRECTLDREGLSLQIPAIVPIPALTLQFAYGGRRLFSPRDVGLAEELVAMLRHALSSRTAYENGVAEERRRIARDMHDNIGAQLLGALHSPDSERKNAMISETLSDLHDIINNASAPGLALDEILADLRVESSERLDAAGIECDWDINSDVAPPLSPQAAHALRSIIREAVSNIIKHAGAHAVQIEVGYREGRVSLSIEDDGKGLDPDLIHAGNGLGNMQARLAGLNGHLELSRGAVGLRITAGFPLDASVTTS